MEETVSCFCNACAIELGQFRNAWNVVGSNYYCPVYPILTFENGFIGEGDVRSLVLGNHAPCLMQDLTCKKCKTFVGIRCDSAPSGHVLKKNQYLLRLSNITTLVTGTKKKATINVTNTYILESADVSRRKSSRAPSVGSSRSKSMSAHPPSHKRDSFSMPPPPVPVVKINETSLSTSTQAQPSSAFQQWAEKEIKDQRREISRISAVAEQITSTINDFKTFMQEAREERYRAQKRCVENYNASRCDNLALLVQLEGLERKISQAFSDAQSDSQDSLAKETKRLTESIEGISQKAASESDSVKSSIKLLEEQVKNLTAQLAVVDKKTSKISGTAKLDMKNQVPSANGSKKPELHRPKMARRSMNEFLSVQDLPEHQSLEDFADQRPRSSEPLTTAESRSTRTTTRKSKFRVEVPVSKPDEHFAMALSSPDSTSSCVPAEVVPAPKDIRKRKAPSKPDTRSNGAGDSSSKKAKRTSSSSLEEVTTTTIRSNVPLHLESPESDISDDIARKNHNPLSAGSVGIQTAANDISSAAHNPVSAYSSSYHSSSNHKIYNAALPPTSSMNLPSNAAPLPLSNKRRSQTLSYNSNTPLPSVEIDAGRSSKPQHAKRPKTMATPLSLRDNTAQATPEQVENPYKCGGCDSRFSRPQALREHKNSYQRCKEYTSRDSIPTHFICGGCQRGYDSLIQFKSHNCPSLSQRDPVEATIERKEVKWKNDEERKRAMADREKLVRDTMEREMGNFMSF